MAGPAPVAIIMGSQSDWSTMRHAAETLDALGVGYDKRIVSAHRTPDRLYAFAKGAKAAGVKVIIAGAGGAAHLPGMTAAMTTLPVFGVPVESKAMSGVDSLYSIVQMPPGVPVGTLAIGKSGAINAALLAASVLALAAARLGFKCHVFCPDHHSPAFDVVRSVTEADYLDMAALDRFAADVDVVTYEFENVPAETATFLSARKPVLPDPKVLLTTQDRLTEKEFVTSLGIGTAKFAAVDSPDALASALRKVGR